MKNIVTSFCLIVLISCGGQNNESSKIENDLIDLNLKGNVKDYNTKEYEVQSYEFGEPKYKSISSTTTHFNSYGFLNKHNWTAYDGTEVLYKGGHSIDYQDPTIGLISKIVNYGGDYKDLFYEYDSISNKIVKVKKFKTEDGPPEIDIYEYDDSTTKVFKYDELGELKRLVVEKFDEIKNPISVIGYDKDGQILDEEYYIYFDDGSKKDSIIRSEDYVDARYSRSSWIEVFIYDDKGRLRKVNIYDDENLNKIQDVNYDYDEGNFNSSYNQFVYKGKDSELVYSVRVSRSYDEIGNIIEEISSDMENDKIFMKTVYSYNYYSN